MHNHSISSKKYRDKRRKLEPWYPIVKQSKMRAKYRGVEFNLTYEWARERYTGYCELTGIAFNTTSHTATPYSLSLDRIDNTKGYTTDNCRFILMAINAFKGVGAEDIIYKTSLALLYHKPEISGLYVSLP